ncbi:MAG TPA: hypothetical protein V6C91_14900 [Coleofasciculaceae cyanobacterium]
MYFEPPELVGKLIDEVGQMPGALPLLSFTLSELYIKLYERWTKDKSTDRALRIKDYDELGGVAGALTRRATQEYDNLVRNFGEASGKAYQATMRRVMLRMVTIEGGGVARRRVPESELKYSSREEDDRVTTVIERLVKARLLVKGQETGEPYVEPAHEFLVRGWDKLQSWIKERQEELILLRRLVFAVDDWVDNHRSEFFLWDDDPRIELLEEILESENNWLNKTELEFVISSLNQQEDELRKTREQLRISEKRRIEAEMREQTVVLLEQLPMQPVETLVSAIQLTGRYLDKLLGEPLSLVQTVLQQAVGLAKEQNMLLNADATYLAISLNGKYILQFGGCFALNLFEWNGNLLKEFSLIDFSESQGRAINIFTAVFSHDNQHIICSDDNGAIYVWDFNFNLIHSPFNPYGTSFIYAIAAHPTKDLIAIASINDDSGFIGIWNWQDNSVSHFFPIFRENFITSLAFSPDGSHILSGNCSDSGKAICLWDLKGNLVNGPLHYSDKTEESFSPKVLFGLNGDNLIVFDSPEVLVWDRQGNLLSKPLENIKSKARCVSISNTGDTICVIDKSGKVYLLDWQGNILNQDSPIKIFSDNINDELFSAIIHPTEPSILTSGSLLSEPPKIWDLRDYLIKHSKATRGEIRSITSVSEQLFASISSRREIQLWNWNGNLHKSFSLETSGSASIGASPDGKLIAIFDGCLKLWSCEGELIREMGGSCSTDFSIVGFSPDYQIIAVYNDSLNKGKVTLNRWSVQGELLSEFIYEDKDGSNVESRVENLTISSDCHYVCIVFQRRYGYIASVSEVKIVDIKNNSVSTLANHHATEDAIVTTTIFPQEITVAAFSPNGKHIATLAADNTLQIWDYEGNPVGKRFQLQDLGTAVTFSSDGRYIACGNAEGGVHLYDYKGSLIGNFSGNTSRIGGIAFSPDGQTLVSGDYSGTLRLYRVHWKAWLQLACDRLRFHPVFKEPQTEMSQQACKTCTDHIWNGTDLLEIFVSKGNSESKARQLTISTLIEKGQKLAQIGRIEAAIAAYTQAQELDPEVEIPASAWGELAWFAGLHGYASSPEIRAACEKAVESAPTDSAWRDSRGLVRTINGDIKGAIEDFQAFIKWTPDKTKKRQFQRWLNKLRSGVSPFTAGELERLRKLVELEKLTAPDENY